MFYCNAVYVLQQVCVKLLADSVTVDVRGEQTSEGLPLSASSAAEAGVHRLQQMMASEAVMEAIPTSHSKTPPHAESTKESETEERMPRVLLDSEWLHQTTTRLSAHLLRAFRYSLVFFGALFVCLDRKSEF